MTGSYSTAFTSGFPGFDPAGAYTGKYGNLFDKQPVNKGTSKSMAVFDPTMLALGGVSSLASLFGGIGQRQTSANIAQAQLAAQNAALMEGRQQAYGSLGASMFGPLFSAGAGGDIEFNRQKAAKMFEAGPLAERFGAQEFDVARGKLGLEGSAEAKELTQRANRAQLKQSLAEKEAAMAGMFGRIAPRDVSTFFV